MKRWAWIVAALYATLLVLLTVPAILGFFSGTKLAEAFSFVAFPPYWPWLAVMLLCELSLLGVPVRQTCLRPVSRGPVWRTVLAGGFMAGCLVAGALLSLYEFLMHRADLSNGAFLLVVVLAVFTWIIWALVFYRIGRAVAADMVSRHCRSLIKGSILELLIAVPTHVVVRHRNNCCAGLLTFIGITMGISVMLCAFGPAVFFLFAARWKRLHPRENLPEKSSQL